MNIWELIILITTLMIVAYLYYLKAWKQYIQIQGNASKMLLSRVFILYQENRARLQEEETELQKKEAQIKIYDLMVAQHSKAKKRLNKQAFSLVKRLYDSFIHRILGQRLFLETLNDKKAQVYSNNLKRLEENLKGFYDFCNDIFHEIQEAGHKCYLSLGHKLLNQQRKQTTETDYIEVT